MIRAVFIDIDDTLLDFTACTYAAIERAAADFDIEFSERLIRVFHNINRTLWRSLEEGAITKEELFAVRWQKIFAAIGISADGPAFETAFRKNLGEEVIPVEGAKEMLEYLSGKYELYAASNGPHEQQVRRLRDAGMLHHFRDVFTSERMGAPKPERAFFEACFREACHLFSHEVMMLGDSRRADIAGAKKLGMPTCHFDLRGYPNWDNVEDADYTILHLGEIRRVL